MKNTFNPGLILLVGLFVYSLIYVATTKSERIPCSMEQQNSILNTEIRKMPDYSGYFFTGTNCDSLILMLYYNSSADYSAKADSGCAALKKANLIGKSIVIITMDTVAHKRDTIVRRFCN